MAITRLDADAFTSSDFGGTPITMAYSVSSGTNRMLAVMMSYEDYNSGISYSTITYGGQSTTIAIQAAALSGTNSNSAVIAYLLDSDIDAATGTTIDKTYVGSTPDVEMIGAISYEGVDQTGGATTNPATNSDTDTTGTNPLVADLTETDEGLVVAAFGMGSNNSVSWSSDMTEQFDEVSTDPSGGTFSLADRLSITSANVDIETTGVSPNRQALVSASFAPAVSLATAQEGFRGRNDDGSETTATWIAAQDTNFDVDSGELFRIRFIVDTTGTLPSSQFTLEEQETGETPWRKVPIE